MDKTPYFSIERVLPGKDQWLLFLRTLKNELASFLDCTIVETSVFLEEEDITHQNFSCSVDIIAHIFPEANLQYGGIICYTKNYDEHVHIDVFLLAYLNGQRVKSNNKAFKYLTINYDSEKGWNSPKW